MIIKNCHRDCDLVGYDVNTRSDIFVMEEHTLDVRHVLDLI